MVGDRCDSCVSPCRYLEFDAGSERSCRSPTLSQASPLTNLLSGSPFKPASLSWSLMELLVSLNMVPLPLPKPASPSMAQRGTDMLRGGVATQTSFPPLSQMVPQTGARRSSLHAFNSGTRANLAPAQQQACRGGGAPQGGLRLNRHGLQLWTQRQLRRASLRVKLRERRMRQTGWHRSAGSCLIGGRRGTHPCTIHPIRSIV